MSLCKYTEAMQDETELEKQKRGQTNSLQAILNSQSLSDINEGDESSGRHHKAQIQLESCDALHRADRVVSPRNITDGHWIRSKDHGRGRNMR